MQTFDSFKDLEKYLDWYSLLPEADKKEEIKQMDLREQDREKKLKEKK